ncbi:MAG: four-carbon acid sugar kinase family protein [Dysosmobacter sp.]
MSSSATAIPRFVDTSLRSRTLRTELEALLPSCYDGRYSCRFLEGSRYAIEQRTYVREGDTLVPAGETEFARDTTFAYRASDLAEWCQEKTGGAYPAEQVGVHLASTSCAAATMTPSAKSRWAFPASTRWWSAPYAMTM